MDKDIPHEKLVEKTELLQKEYRKKVSMSCLDFSPNETSHEEHVDDLESIDPQVFEHSFTDDSYVDDEEIERACSPDLIADYEDSVIEIENPGGFKIGRLVQVDSVPINARNKLDKQLTGLYF